MRLLNYHERKHIKRVDFFTYKKENTIREVSITRKFLISNRNDYIKYRKLISQIKKLIVILTTQFDNKDKFRISMVENLSQKLYDIGVVNYKDKFNLKKINEQLSVSALCRRRLGCVLVRLRFVKTLKEAVSFIEAGHVRVGVEVVTDPSMIVTRDMEDYVTWVDSSRIKRHIEKFNNQMDDYDLLFA